MNLIQGNKYRYMSAAYDYIFTLLNISTDMVYILIDSDTKIYKVKKSEIMDNIQIGLVKEI